MTRKMKDTSKNTLEQVLETLYNNERELFQSENKAQMSFSMTDIHLSTYMKICKILKIEGGESLIE